MHQTLAVFPKGDANRAGISYNLLSVQESSGLLLPDPELKNGEAEIVSKFPIDGNGAFDIYEGLYLKGRKCTIKMIRSLRNSPMLSKVLNQYFYFSRVMLIDVIPVAIHQ